jgi:hypothetical protein
MAQARQRVRVALAGKDGADDAQADQAYFTPLPLRLAA